MMRWLAAQGLRPLLLDWGWPGEAERRFTLTDYIAGRLERALAAVGDAGRARGLLHGRAARRSRGRSGGRTSWQRSRCWRRPGISMPATRSAHGRSPGCCRCWSRRSALGNDAADRSRCSCCSRCSIRMAIAEQIPRLRPSSTGQPARRTVRCAGRLAERRRAAGRAGRARVPARLVRRERAGTRRMAGRRAAASIQAALRAARLRGGAGARPDRAARKRQLPLAALIPARPCTSRRPATSAWRPGTAAEAALWRPLAEWVRGF